MLSKSSVAAPAGSAVVPRIAGFYGLDVAEILEPQKGYRNESYPVRLRDGRMLNLMLYKTEPGMARTIRNADGVSGFLAGHGLPVRCPADGRVVRIRAGGRVKYAALYNYLPGHTIAWEAYTQKHLKLLGRSMSDMHAALQGYDARELPDVAGLYLQIMGRMQRYFAWPGVAGALESKLRLQVLSGVCADFEKLLAACGRLPGRQALHMDFVRSNILFDAEAGGEPRISGILDFEKAACGHPAFDVARTLSFLLVDCKYKPAGKVRKYFLHSGYRKYGAANLQRVTIRTPGGSRPLLEALLDVFLYYDFYKFLRHNPYESLPRNEHFVRTRDLLLERGLIGRTS